MIEVRFRRKIDIEVFIKASKRFMEKVRENETF